LIETIPETGSTNADLLARLASGGAVGEGDWLVADRQTAGRGRQGRTWFDGNGNFMGSTTVHCLAGDPPPASLALVAGLAVQAAVSPHVLPPAHAVLKWPNDVMVGNAKLAGILLERAGDAVVVGVGVNLAQAPEVPGRETVACTRFGPAPNRDAFATELERAFDGELQLWRQYGLEATIARWQACAHPIGTVLFVTPPGEAMFSGHYAGLDGSGALRLALPDGTTRIVHAGEILFA